MNKAINLIVIILLTASAVKAGKISVGYNNNQPHKHLKVSDTIVSKPMLDSLAQLGRLIKYPASAPEEIIFGKVMVVFNVNTDNKVTNYKIIRSLSDDLNTSVISALKKWTAPAGFPKNINILLPINFILREQGNDFTAFRSGVYKNNLAPEPYIANNYKEYVAPEYRIFAYAQNRSGVFMDDKAKAQLDSFYKRLALDAIYPDLSRKNTIQGRITAQFNVNNDHQIVNVGIITGLSDDLNAEVIRLLNGRRVPACFQTEVNYKAPFTFYVSHTDGTKPGPSNYTAGKISLPPKNDYPVKTLNTTVVAGIVASGEN